MIIVRDTPAVSEKYGNRGQSTKAIKITVGVYPNGNPNPNCTLIKTLTLTKPQIQTINLTLTLTLTLTHSIRFTNPHPVNQTAGNHS